MGAHVKSLNEMFLMNTINKCYLKKKKNLITYKLYGGTDNLITVFPYFAYTMYYILSVMAKVKLSINSL